MPFSENVLAALIGAVAALITMIFKDVILKRWHEYNNKKKNDNLVFREYADPLSSSTMSLLWRLNEILEQNHQSSYLLTKYMSEYAEYKRLSTVYRLASLLGWLQAFNKETTLLKSKDNKQLKAIKNSINEFKASLADGNHIEIQRLTNLLDLWKFHFKDCPATPIIASLINNEIKNYIKSKDKDYANKLDTQEKLELCKSIAQILCDSYKISNLPNEIINETISQFIHICSIKECWIYREWQEAIGDVMLKKAHNSNRRYDVLGYYEFCKISKEESEDKKWLSLLDRLFYDLDMTGLDKADMRFLQLKKITVAASDIFLSLTTNDEKTKILMKKTINLAHDLKQRLV